MAGLFVTFEGGEGSGKSTQVARLAARLRARGLDPLVTREPGGTTLAEGIRGLLLDPERRPTALAEAFLMQAARAQLVETVIRPALDDGRVVLCDRYDDSTLAYQGAGRGLDARMLADWSRTATAGLVPTMTLLFDVPKSIPMLSMTSPHLSCSLFVDRVCSRGRAGGERGRFRAKKNPPRLSRRVG